ncbi:alpha beta-hydrolase [Fusarium mexicanum]|uniref:Carboxylic ester hydrolase n=1 Tax=Fusarium mexicanum TaxID=751941 RepID=A0A8H5IUW9_9HYPO|nr:alpha beta-hydrolase [Fusarium mexicanum]
MRLRPTCVPLMAMVLFFTLASAVAPVVDVSYSKYRGKDLRNGVTHWLGMRYAAPPLGDLRFMPPQDPVRSRQTKNANKQAQSRLKCVSQSAKARFIGKSQSEDCLFLNVFAPSNASRHAKLPVFVYIQGGGFNDISRPKINGADLIRASDMKMVVVTLNYRVSVLGFLSYGDKVQPNNGLLDQRKALEWVQKYISRFGGNPRHVVLGGSSSGGASVAFHLAAYGGRDDKLFHASAAESISASPIKTVEQASYQAESFIEKVGCSSQDAIACMRAKTIAEIIAANIKVPYPGGTRLPIGMWGPVIDGDFVRDALWNSFDQGKFVKVPSIIGATTNEGRAFAPAASSKTEVEDFFKAEFPLLESAHITQITALYPGLIDTCSKAGCLKRPLSDAYGNMRFQCSGISLSESISRWMPKKTWNYWYNVEDPGFIAQGRGVPHCDEAHAIWGPGNGGSGAPRSYFPGGINGNAVNVVQGDVGSLFKGIKAQTGV